MTKFVNRAETAFLLRQIDLFLLNLTRAVLQTERNARICLIIKIFYLKVGEPDYF
jgi:hypothetical protein